jgi:hypothetical protein
MKRILFTIVLIILIDFVCNKSNAQIVINEIMASNSITYLDEHNKNFLDWIELYNYSDNEISIGGWYLTDNKNKPKKWKIPFYISLAAKELKLFWIDDLNSSIHTNFKLSVDGESIYLYNNDTVLIDSISYPPQATDISYGRVAGLMDQLVYFNEATPMKENPLYGYESLDFSNEPIFSKKAGFYQNAISLELSVSSNKEKIYYTLDGTIPTQASLQYSHPIEIINTSVIRARTYHESKLPSKIITKTYFIKELCSLPVFSIVTDPLFLWDKNYGIYVDGTNYRKNIPESANYSQSWERPINIEYFDINGKSGFNINAGVKIHGRSTRNNAQKSLAIFAKEKYCTSIIPYKLYGDKSPDTIKTFILRNAGNDWGITMFLDGLVHTLVIGNIDIDAQLYQPAIVFLNGKYWGIHNIREKINEHYIRAKYHFDSTNFDIIEADGRLAGKMEASYGNMDEYNKMIKYIETHKLSIKENYDTLKEWIDINEIINYMSTQVYIDNRDWPNSNMKFWKSRDKSGNWRWILYDTEMSFKKCNEYFKFNTIENMLAENSEYYSTAPWSNFIIRKLFESEEFKIEFIQRMAIYLNTVFEPNHVLFVLDSLKENIEPEIKRNLMRWGGIHQNTVPYLETSSTYEEWEANIEFVRNFVKDRPSAVRKNIIEYFNLKDTINLNLRVSDHNAGKISLMNYTLKEGRFDGYIFAEIPIRMEAIPNEGYEFVKWRGESLEKKCMLNLKNNKKLTAVFRKIE